MDIDDLKEALKASPKNLPLRLLLAEALLKAGRQKEAEQEYLKALQIEDNLKSRLALARLWLKAENTSAVVIFLEESIELHPQEVAFQIMLAKAYLQEDNQNEARALYEKVLSLNPENRDEELDRTFRLGHTEAQNAIDEHFMERPEIRFEDVGGMQEVKKDISLKIIHAIKHPEMYEAYGKKAGGGILMYGPPGCGKTYIARATAGEIDARFINISINDILDMWIGNSEKNLHQFFELAREHKPCVIFIDEVDALGASRGQMRNSNSRTLINQFLAELDGINSKNDGVLVLGATNMPWNLDPAFRRPGRFDRILFVPPPDEEARIEILKSQLKGKPCELIDHKKIAAKTKAFSGADLKALIDQAIEQKLEKSFMSGKIEPLQTKDLVKSLKGIKSSTQEWFEHAKNFALFSNSAGTYDPILEYLKIKHGRK